MELWDATGSTRLETGTDLLDANGRTIGQQISHPTRGNETFLLHIALPTGATASVPYSLVLRGLTADLGTQVHGTESGTLASGGQAIYRLGTAVTGSLQVQLSTGANASGAFLLRILSADGLTVLGQATGLAAPGQTLTASVPVQGGQVVLLQAARGTGDFLLDFTNLDQFQNPNPSTLLLPAARWRISMTCMLASGLNPARAIHRKPPSSAWLSSVRE